MKRKVLVLMLTAGMLSSGFAANIFASDSNEDIVQFSEDAEPVDGVADEIIDGNLTFEADGEAEESEDVFSDTEDFTTDTEISDADSSGEMQESEQEVTPIPSAEPTPTIVPSTEPEPTAMPTPTPSRPLRIYKVTQSTVKGLEKPLKFTPGKFYNFTVTGAGMDNKSPISGDVRWVPMYWSTSQNPTSSAQKNTIWKIGSPKGIRDKKTYNMYIFFKKQIYNGKSWKDSDVIQSITKKFTSAALTDEDLGIYHMKVNTKSVVLRAGQSTSAVKVTNATSSFRVVAWYSANTSIARVNAQGRITAGKKTGSTYITIVMSTGEKTKVKVTVQNGTVRTNAIYGLKTKYTVTKGKTTTLKPVLSPVTSQERITYSSSNKNVATVSSKGVIKGIKAGTARITVKSGKVQTKCKVTVK